jgi:ribosomal 30S subunit maturation factor RimM
MSEKRVESLESERTSMRHADNYARNTKVGGVVDELLHTGNHDLTPIKSKTKKRKGETTTCGE